MDVNGRTSPRLVPFLLSCLVSYPRVLSCLVLSCTRVFCLVLSLGRRTALQDYMDDYRRCYVAHGAAAAAPPPPSGTEQQPRCAACCKQACTLPRQAANVGCCSSWGMKNTCTIPTSSSLLFSSFLTRVCVCVCHFGRLRGSVVRLLREQGPGVERAGEKHPPSSAPPLSPVVFVVLYHLDSATTGSCQDRLLPRQARDTYAKTGSWQNEWRVFVFSHSARTRRSRESSARSTRNSTGAPTCTDPELKKLTQNRNRNRN